MRHEVGIRGAALETQPSARHCADADRHSHATVWQRERSQCCASSLNNKTARPRVRLESPRASTRASEQHEVGGSASIACGLPASGEELRYAPSAPAVQPTARAHFAASVSSTGNRISEYIGPYATPATLHPRHAGRPPCRRGDRWYKGASCSSGGHSNGRCCRQRRSIAGQGW